MNLVDWSANNVLAVALGSSVYLWNADSGTIDQLLELEGADYVCSLSWMQEGNLIAVGTSLGGVQVSSESTPHTIQLHCNILKRFVSSYGMSRKRNVFALWTVIRYESVRYLGILI